MSKAVNSKWKKTFPDTIGNQNRPATGVDDTQPFETGAFPQYMANDPVRYDLQNAAMSQSMSNDARLKEMVDARGKELDDHKVDPGAHETGIAGNAATATKVVTTAVAGTSANIAEATMASSDSARIRVSGAENAGELALETSDDGNEAIVARQYTGAYTNAVRTAKILDESGNTSFPGTVVAPKFTGALNGNAATATKLQTARTLSLTGKAAGSATFDGSANVAINVTSVNADTASKLSTARKINITGNASGSANFDGTSDVSINVSVSQAAHADTLKSSAATETSTVARPIWLSWEGDNTKQTVSPNLTYTCSTKTLTAANFKGHLTGTADNADKVDGIHAASLFYRKGDWDADNWATIGTYQTNGTPPVSGAYGWGQVISSSTDYARFQLYVSDNYGENGRLYYRTGWSNTKHQWNTILDSENYNSFAPTKTGGGASGTWGINISGNAASATNADKLDGYHASDLLSKIYPVGSIYMSMSATNPATLFGVGTWKRISQGRMLLGADDSTYKAGATGGEATHTLSVNEIPAHSHGISNSGDHTHNFYGSDGNNGQFTEGDGLDTEANKHYTHNERYTTSSAGAHTHTISNAGGGAAHNNMPPYLVCYIWQRTA